MSEAYTSAASSSIPAPSLESLIARARELSDDAQVVHQADPSNKIARFIAASMRSLVAMVETITPAHSVMVFEKEARADLPVFGFCAWVGTTPSQARTIEQIGGAL
jgi:hypothetical protein